MQDTKKTVPSGMRPAATPEPVFPKLRWVTERGLRVETGEQTLSRYGWLLTRDLPEVEAIVPADESLLIVLKFGASVSASLRALLAAPLTEAFLNVGRLHEIAVRYGGEAGPDVAALAERTGLRPEEWIATHAAVEYRVEFLGFQPGFPYLAGLPEPLWAPRRDQPRVRVPAGSLAIGGRYTGIYPMEGPGGWQIVGHTDAVLFDLARASPSLFSPGDRVRFVAI